MEKERERHVCHGEAIEVAVVTREHSNERAHLAMAERRDSQTKGLIAPESDATTKGKGKSPKSSPKLGRKNKKDKGKKKGHEHQPNESRGFAHLGEPAVSFPSPPGHTRARTHGPARPQTRCSSLLGVIG